jgi:hypothetical protein
MMCQAFRRTSFALVVLCSAAPVLGRLIDDFEQGAFSIDSVSGTATPGFINQPGLDPQHTLMGFRGVFLDAPTTGNTTVDLISGDAQDDALVMRVPAGHTGVLGLAYLDALASAPSPKMGDLDLLSDGANAFAITVTEAPDAFQLDAFLSTDPLGEHRGTIIVQGSGPGTYILKFDDVRPYSGETAPDFADVDYLSFHFLTRADSAPVSIAISEIHSVVVPEPGPAGVALLCTVAIVGLRRRCRGQRV